MECGTQVGFVYDILVGLDNGDAGGAILFALCEGGEGCC